MKEKEAKPNLKPESTFRKIIDAQEIEGVEQQKTYQLYLETGTMKGSMKQGKDEFSSLSEINGHEKDRCDSQ